jgi:hypothetical protein
MATLVAKMFTQSKYYFKRESCMAVRNLFMATEPTASYYRVNLEYKTQFLHTCSP